MTKNLSNLGRTADGIKFAYLNLSLPGANLQDISCLAKFKEIQTLDLSFNNISGKCSNFSFDLKLNFFCLFIDLSVLSELPYLLYLSVSNNKIEKLFDFLPSYSLKEADFSFNKITEIGNLSNYYYLQTLQLNSNFNMFFTRLYKISSQFKI